MIMIRYIIVAILFELLFGCKSNVGQEQKIVFSGYSIPIAGGHIDMKLDSITPLTELIPQLRSNNKLYETGKGYWIGYNDLMFSIAVYSDTAIKPLADFIDTTTNYDSKVAAIYTLHLIGIKCRLAGRTHEEFTNIKAREEILKLMAKHDSLQTLIMTLLIRDPRESDIPILLNIMNTSKTDCWSISNGLMNYNLNNVPRELRPSNDYFYNVFIQEKDDRLALTKKNLWIDWWSSQSQSYKDSLIKSEKRIIIN